MCCQAAVLMARLVLSGGQGSWATSEAICKAPVGRLAVHAYACDARLQTREYHEMELG
jgi:hypothetical protein